MNNLNHQFKCRIFAGKVISVECPGFPSELFAVRIVGGRITLHNIGRKQCRENLKTNKSKSEIGSTHAVIVRQQVPVASSTPAKTYRLEKENIQPERRFSTPDIVRRAVCQERNSPIPSPTVQQRLKLVPLHRSPTLNTPKKLAKIAPCTRTNSNTRTPCVTQIQILRNLANLSNFSTPASPRTADNTHVVFRSPNQSLITKLISSPYAGSVKWRKCLTPQRTYVRRGVNTIQQNKSTTKSSQLLRSPKVIPTYLINQTKYPAGDGRVIYRRRKLIVDKKLMISPQTFKKQLQSPQDLTSTDKHLPKTRKQFIYSHQLAFDLLTNSSYYPRCAKSLNSRFRRACLNKKSETILKYQQLIKAIPALEG